MDAMMAGWERVFHDRGPVKKGEALRHRRVAEHLGNYLYTPSCTVLADPRD